MDRGGVSRKEAENTTLSEALDRYSQEVSSKKREPTRNPVESNFSRPINSENAFWLQSRGKTSQYTGMNVPNR